MPSSPCSTTSAPTPGTRVGTQPQCDGRGDASTCHRPSTRIAPPLSTGRRTTEVTMTNEKEDLGEGWLDKGVVIGSSTDEVWGANAGISILVNVHEPALCTGRHCVI